MKFVYTAFVCNYTIILANNKGADQTGQIRRLICAIVVFMPPTSKLRVHIGLCLPVCLRVRNAMHMVKKG